MRVTWCVLSIAFAILLIACQTPPNTTPTPLSHTATPTTASLPTPTLALPASPPPLVSPSPPLPLASPSPLPDTNWQSVTPGREERTINLIDDTGRVIETLYLTRLDQAHYRFDIAYTPGEPQTLRQWQEQTGAEIVVNGGYFTEEYFATGLIITAGQAAGQSYGDFAGMVAINNTKLDLRWLADSPYNPNEPLTAALQSFPLLVKPGGQLGFPAESETGRRARRTVIGLDTSGRVLLIVTPRGHFTLHELSHYLTTSDLNLHIALNLDGGPSTGLLTNTADQGYPPFVALPAVITVYPK